MFLLHVPLMFANKGMTTANRPLIQSRYLVDGIEPESLGLLSSNFLERYSLLCYIWPTTQMGYKTLMIDFGGGRVVINGAAEGMGRALVVCFAECGARVVGLRSPWH